MVRRLLRRREPDSNPRSRASVSTGASGAREATHVGGREARMTSVADSLAKLVPDYRDVPHIDDRRTPSPRTGRPEPE